MRWAYTVEGVYRFLATPRWIAGFLVIVLAAAIMVRLGLWQWDRGQQKAAANDAVEAARTTDPVPAADLIPPDPQQRPAAADEWSRVTLTGTYDPAGTVLVRQRSFDRGVGFEVVVPIQATDGVTYLIDRGYVLATGDATEAPDVPAPPSGEVTVTGIVKRPFAAGENATRVEQIGPYRAVRALDPVTLSASLGAPVAGGYVIAADEVTAAGTPVTDISRIPDPDLSDGPHLSYAVQWWIFAAMTLGVFGYLARREAITRLLADDDLDDDDPDDHPDGDDPGEHDVHAPVGAAHRERL